MPVFSLKVRIKSYELTLLKKFHQSTRPSKIKENIKDLKCLQTLFKKLELVIKHLNLSPEIVKYYAQIVIKSQVFQISRREERKYLYIIVFVIHQYHRLNDLLVEILIQTVQSGINASIREHKETFYKTRKSRHQAINDLAQTLNKQIMTLQKIEEVIHNQRMTPEERVETIKSFLSRENKPDYYSIQERLVLLEKDSRRIMKEDDYYIILES